MLEFILFCLSSVGMTHIIVDGSIFSGFREWASNKFPKSIGKIVNCHMCCGWYSGVLCGIILLSYNPIILFTCGCASSFLSMFFALIFTYLEARSIVDLGGDKQDGK